MVPRNNDSIIGDNNNNTLYGGLGTDTLKGGDGIDILNGYLSGIADDESDWVDYSYLDSPLLNSGLGKVFVDLAAVGQNATVSTTDRDTLTNIENIIGSKNDDTIYGNSADNTIFLVMEMIRLKQEEVHLLVMTT